MKWKKHIDHIALKVSKIIGIMYCLKFILPADVLLMIYNSLILPHFNYCHLAWGSNITVGHKLHLLQKKAVRIVDHRHFLAHTEPICKRLRIVLTLLTFDTFDSLTGSWSVWPHVVTPQWLIKKYIFFQYI